MPGPEEPLGAAFVAALRDLARASGRSGAATFDGIAQALRDAGMSCCSESSLRRLAKGKTGAPKGTDEQLRRVAVHLAGEELDEATLRRLTDLRRHADSGELAMLSKRRLSRRRDDRDVHVDKRPQAAWFVERLIGALSGGRVSARALQEFASPISGERARAVYNGQLLLLPDAMVKLITNASRSAAADVPDLVHTYCDSYARELVSEELWEKQFAMLRELARRATTPRGRGGGTGARFRMDDADEHDDRRWAEWVLRLPPERPAKAPAFAVDSALPRLKRLHELAVTDAATVSGGHLADEGPWRTLDDGLYVRRDLEPELLGLLTGAAPRVVLIYGEAGIGKTSLLWGLATALAATPGRETFLLKSRWLVSDGNGGPHVDPAALESAIRSAANEGRSCTVLIDTADLIAVDDHGRIALVDFVAAAVDASTTVLITSRVQESQLLPRSWLQHRLRAYAVPDDRDRGAVGPEPAVTQLDVPCEFERAVAAHARFHCPDLAAARPMTEQLLRAVTRRQHLGRMARHPLTLRMLFEIYQPATVPENIDLTDLYGQVWIHRVCRDRGNWGSERPDDRDLSETAMALALGMLRHGSPEIATRLVAPSDASRGPAFEEDVALLCRRGVGHRTTAGVFTYFHQTFFEFAAGQALLHQHPRTAVRALRRRAVTQPDDYFTLAVLEQTWLWAWRRQSTAPFAVAEAKAVLDDHADMDAMPYALRRTAFSVVVQSPALPEDLRRTLVARIAGLDLSVLRDILALLPAPSRRPDAFETNIVRQCLQRNDAAWASAVPLLGRLAQRRPNLVADALDVLPLIERISEVAPGQKADHRDLIGLLAKFFRIGGTAEKALTVLCRGAIARGQDGYLAAVLDGVRRPGAAADIARWVDSVVTGKIARRQTISYAHALVHYRAILDGPGPSWPAVLGELNRVVDRFRAPDTVDAGTTARLGGLVLALARHGPTALAPEAAAILRRGEHPVLHSALHRGWLSEFVVGHADALHGTLVGWLRAGLPTQHAGPEGSDQRWADTVRRALERSDVPSAVAGRICADVVDDRDDPCNWLDTDRLLRLVVKGAAAGIPGALTAAYRLGAGTERLHAEAYRTLTQQMVSSVASLDECHVLVDMLLSAGDVNALCKLAEADPTAIATPLRDRRDQARDAAVSALTSHQEAKRKHAGRLLRHLVLAEIIDPPPWETLVGWAAERTAPPVRAAVAEIAHHGLGTGVYDYPAVRKLLLQMCRPTSGFAIPERVDALTARRMLVLASATWGPADDLDLLKNLAFAPPIDGQVAAKATIAAQPALRRGGSLPPEVACQLVLDVGILLTGEQVGSRARKDAGNRCRAAMAAVVDQADASELCRIATELPHLERHYAAAFAGVLRPARHPQLRTLMQQLLERRTLDEMVRRSVVIALEDTAAHHEPAPWHTFEADLLDE